MNLLKVDVHGISETFWKGSGEFMYELPSGERFKIQGRGAFIIGTRIIKAMFSYQPISERHMTLKVTGRARDILIHHVYAPNMDDDEEEVEKLYRSIEIEGKRQKKWKDIITLLGDFNAKVENERYEDTRGPYGLGETNER